MTSIPATHDLNRTPVGLAPLLAAGAGFSVASIYYSQPMLPDLARGLQVGEGAIGAVPTLTQLGYAAGILLLAPLGDRFDRRRVMLVKSMLLAVMLLVCALAPNVPVLLVASLFIGLAATAAQDFVPAAVSLAPEHQRGKAVGAVMTGLLLGILLSRVVSGLVTQALGWRAMFGFAAASLLLLALAVQWRVPAFAPTTRLPYGDLLKSMAGLWRQHALLRRAAVAQALLGLGFSAFWSTLAVMLHARFGMGSGAAGAFGLAGAAGALAAPIAGRLSDRVGPRRVVLMGTGVAALAYALMLGMDFLPMSGALLLLVLSTIGFDFGFQASLIAHQSTVYGLDPAARSRLNAILITAMFVGMAGGSVLGSLLWAHWGWPAVALLGVSSALGAALWRWRA
ncbi:MULTISPECIES: MFS transporter [Hydrogenophaga]|uniref:Major facilitator transporter n=1 Tax=Hydrogenophaga intermedia TaxID=65786 RepID=A0A1L1PLR8_HYDIT|nr:MULTISPECIES: MFS transporter [Hydrogenophaga]AOS79006.1 MFS transporter [Hydrogenophaga sp. PBC]TMU74537.1 MFS transporter [Hydrogenophaga intermedia]CDN87877.1 Major facilitator transporter [Hydrogenophaga intermedia]